MYKNPRTLDIDVDKWGFVLISVIPHNSLISRKKPQEPVQTKQYFTGLIKYCHQTCGCQQSFTGRRTIDFSERVFQIIIDSKPDYNNSFEDYSSGRVLPLWKASSREQSLDFVQNFNLRISKRRAMPDVYGWNHRLESFTMALWGGVNFYQFHKIGGFLKALRMHRTEPDNLRSSL